MLKKIMILLITLLLAGCAPSSNKTLSTNEVMKKLASYTIDANSNIAYYCYQNNMAIQHYFYPEMEQNNVFIYSYDYDNANQLQQFHMEIPTGKDTLDAYVANFYTGENIVFDYTTTKLSSIVSAQDLLIELDNFYDFSKAEMITTEFTDSKIHLVYSIGDKYVDLTEYLQKNQIVLVEEKEYSNPNMSELTRISITTSTPPSYEQMVKQSNSLVNANISETIQYNEFE